MTHSEHYLLIKIDDLIMAIEHDLEADHAGLTPHRKHRLTRACHHLRDARVALLHDDFEPVDHAMGEEGRL